MQFYFAASTQLRGSQFDPAHVRSTLDPRIRRILRHLSYTAAHAKTAKHHITPQKSTDAHRTLCLHSQHSSQAPSLVDLDDLHDRASHLDFSRLLDVRASHLDFSRLLDVHVRCGNMWLVGRCVFRVPLECVACSVPLIAVGHFSLHP